MAQRMEFLMALHAVPEADSKEQRIIVGLMIELSGVLISGNKIDFFCQKILVFSYNALKKNLTNKKKF